MQKSNCFNIDPQYPSDRQQQQFDGGQNSTILQSNSFKSNLIQQQIMGDPINDKYQQGHQGMQNDNRKSIRSIKFPFTAIGLLSITNFYKNKNKIIKFLATGCLIDNNLALTAAHNIYNRQMDIMASKMFFTIGLSGGVSNSCVFPVSYAFIPYQYKTKEKQEQAKQYDYALLILNTRQKLGQIYGAFDLNPYQESSQIVLNQMVSLYGFPADLNQKLNNSKKIFSDVFGAQNNIQKMSEKMLFYHIPSNVGQNGSPIFRKGKRKYELLGIHSGKNKFGAYGIKITKQVKNRIYSWAINIEQKPTSIEQINLTVDNHLTTIKQIKFTVQKILMKKKQKANVRIKTGLSSQIAMNQFQKQINRINDPKKLLEMGRDEYWNKNDCLKAMKLLERSLKLFENSNQGAGLQCGKVLNGIGNIYNEYRDYQNALEYYKRALKIFQDKQGKQHINYASTLNNIGLVYNKQNKFKEAMQSLQESLANKQKVEGKQSTECIPTITIIGKIYSKQKNYDKAIEMYNEALKISQKHFGKSHPNLCFILNNLGETHYFYKNNKQQGREYIQRSLSIWKNSKYKQHPKYAEALYRLGKMCCEEEKYNKAMNLLQEGKEMLQSIFGKNSNNEFEQKIDKEIEKLNNMELKDKKQIEINSFIKRTFGYKKHYKSGTIKTNK